MENKRKFKIYFDNIIFFLQKSGGGSVYWYELIERFSNSENDVIFIEQKKFTEEMNIFRKRIGIKNLLIENKIKFNILRYLPLTLDLKEEEKFIFHSSYYRICKNKNVINVTTVHDFTYEYFTKGIKKWVHYLQKKYAIKNSEGIICISENTKKDLLKFHPWAKNKKIKVIHNGVGNQFYKLNLTEKKNLIENLETEIKSVLKEKYVLYVGHRTKYKNFDIALEAIGLLPEDYKFVIVGENLNENEKNLVSKIEKRCFHFKGLSIEKLNLLYNEAFCFLYPSSYEGFGIPVLEAMQTGCPVITTNKSSIPEVVGNAAIIVNEISSVKLSEEILKLENKEHRNNLIEKGYIRSKEFSWDKTYKEVNEFYQELLNGEK